MKKEIEQDDEHPTLHLHKQTTQLSDDVADRLFVKEGGCLYYLGDFDSEGLKMAQRLVKRYGDAVCIGAFNMFTSAVARSSPTFKTVCIGAFNMFTEKSPTSKRSVGGRGSSRRLHCIFSLDRLVLRLRHLLVHREDYIASSPNVPLSAERLAKLQSVTIEALQLVKSKMERLKKAGYQEAIWQKLWGEKKIKTICRRPLIV